MQLAASPNAKWNDAGKNSFDVDVLIPGMTMVVRTTINRGDPHFPDGALVSYSSIEAYVPPAVTITPMQLTAYANAKARALINNSRSYTAAGIEITSDATPATRSDLADLAAWGADNPTKLRKWISNTHIVTEVSGAQYVELAPLISAYALSVYDALAHVLQGVQASPPTITSLAQIDSFGWPQQ